MSATNLHLCSVNKRCARTTCVGLSNGVRVRRARLLASAAAIAVAIAIAFALVPDSLVAAEVADAAASRGPQVTEADIARAMTHQPQVTDADMDRARLRNPTPTDAELARVPIPGAVDIDALPKASQSGSRTVNFGDVAQGYEAVRAATQSPLWPASTASLIVFISFSMPQPTLERLTDQAESSGATLVLRGLVNGSLRETVTRCQALIGQRHVAIQIDPQAFDRFAVVQVPTIVLVTANALNAPAPENRSASGALPVARTCAGARCGDEPGFASVQGDVSLAYALRMIAARDQRFASPAKVLLRRLPGEAP